MPRALGVAFVLVAGLAGCSALGGGTSDSLADAVERSAETGDPFRLSSVTDFDWDRVHVVPPYASAEAVNRELGFRWDDAEGAAPRADTAYLMLFVSRGEVIEAFEHNVEGGNLSCLTSEALVRRGMRPGRDLLATKRVRLSRSDTYDLVFPARPRGHREKHALRRCLGNYS